ncbi:MAG: ABC transporter ATP-binding protein [Candidatus Methanomethylophilaceae archaeon]|nr:ABC transporter ATP-binding protein [Candidatus Methanomethylophilaceae archaeon]
MWNLGKFFRYFSRTDYALTAVCAVLVLAQVFLDLRIPEFMQEMTNALQRGTDTSFVIEIGERMLLCALASLVVSILCGTCAARVAASVSREMRAREFANVQRFSTEDMDRFSASSLITRTTNDVSNLLNFLARSLQMFIRAPILGVWALYKIQAGAWQWTVATAATMVVLVMVTAIVLHYALPRFKRIQWLIDDVNRATRENISGTRVVRAYNAEEYQQRKFDSANDVLLENNITVSRMMAPLPALTASLTNILMLGIYWIGASLIVSAGDVDTQMGLFSDMIVFSTYATMVLGSLMLIVGIFRGMPRMLVSIRRINEVVDHVPSMEDGSYEGEGKERGSIEFRSVSFSYPDMDSEVLHDVSFKVEKGQTLAIIGPTGCGKSTMLSLMARLYDVDSGEVLVDGVPVKDYKQSTLHSKIGFVPQKPMIFSADVRENVCLGDDLEKRTDEEIWAALKIAQADGFIDSLDSNLDSKVSQYGLNMSGGQKQRIGIARAVCKDPEFLILDDSFSALDYKTDLDLRTAIRRNLRGTTCVIVAQRVGTIRDADLILVMEDGRIIDRGTHDQLMRTCGMYRDIAEAQMEGGE